MLKASGGSKAALKVSGDKEITDKILTILAKASGSIKQMNEITGEAVKLLSGSGDKIKEAFHEALLVMMNIRTWMYISMIFTAL